MLMTSICLILIKFWISRRYKEIIVTEMLNHIPFFSDPKQKISQFSHFLSISHPLFLHCSSRIHHCCCHFFVESSSVGILGLLFEAIGARIVPKPQLLTQLHFHDSWRIRQPGALLSYETCANHLPMHCTAAVFINWNLTRTDSSTAHQEGTNSILTILKIMMWFW